MVAELHRWSGGVKAMCLAASLRGDAQAILADLEAEKRRNYTDLVDALSSRFGPARQTELRRIQLRNRSRKKGETIPELAQDVKRLTRFAYPGASSHLQDQLARDHFVDCLEEPELRLGVHQTRPKTLEEAVQAALEIEAFYTVERQRNFPLRKAVRVLHSDQGMTNTLAPPLAPPRYHTETQSTDRVQTDTVSELREAVSQLATDIAASDFGVGAVLSQQQGQTERVIAYFSKTLGKAERRYCVTMKELLAIILAVKNFHHYLFGTKFLVRTDHGALRWLLRFRNPEGQARWIETLGNYNFEIQYRPGRVHGNADALSRRPCGECSKCEREESKETMRSATDQGEGSVNCPRLQEVKLCRSLEGPTAKGPEGATEEEPEEKPEGELEEKPGEQPEEEPDEKPEEGEASNGTTSSTPLGNKPT
ncbi:hypothetical protein HOLleu_42404 [Holothuria leucospilota]|uniref:Reverse transcriptase RNase H-like domain-containing protein n=1 Tax=Holothuria leucospilota TaxID=206669 RepID=A0A9Q0YCW4_HOLLE|nr:hypothetical protein HOLleu_42404 [Holothuria leucospilota]